MRRGQVAVYLVMLLVALCVLALLNVDTFVAVRAKNRLQNGGRFYQDRGSSFGSMTRGASPVCCLSLCAINLFCGLCGGGQFFCY